MKKERNNDNIFKKSIRNLQIIIKTSISQLISLSVIIIAIIIGIIAVFSIKIPHIEITDESTISFPESYRNFTSIEETYPILERVARELDYVEYVNNWTLKSSINTFPPLTQDIYYELDGRRFYSHMAFYDYYLSRYDQTKDGITNCLDYAVLFYKYARSEGYNVRIIGNDMLGHAFNSVNINGTWVSIEPQAAEIELLVEPYLANHFTDYDPTYDIEIEEKLFFDNFK